MNNKRELTYICEECFYKLPIIMKAEYTGLNALREKNYIKIDGITGGHLHGVCPNCNNKVFFFAVDKAMGNVVSILNQHEYSTEFSCHGHSYVEFKKNVDNIGYHVAYLYDQTYIAINSINRKEKSILEAFVKADFNEVIFDRLEPIIIKDNLNDYIHYWETSIHTTFYLSRDKIERQYKKVVSEFEGRKMSNNILNKIDEKMDKYFEYKCNQLAKNLEKAFDNKSVK